MVRGAGGRQGAGWSSGIGMQPPHSLCVHAPGHPKVDHDEAENSPQERNHRRPHACAAEARAFGRKGWRGEVGQAPTPPIGPASHQPPRTYEVVDQLPPSEGEEPVLQNEDAEEHEVAGEHPHNGDALKGRRRTRRRKRGGRREGQGQRNKKGCSSHIHSSPTTLSFPSCPPPPPFSLPAHALTLIVTHHRQV